MNESATETILEEKLRVELATDQERRDKIARIAEKARPKGKRVLVRMHREDMTRGGLILTDASKVRETLAIVVACGPEVTKAVKGELVLLMKYVGVDIELPTGGKAEGYKVVHEEEIAASFEDPDLVKDWLGRAKSG